MATLRGGGVLSLYKIEGASAGGAEEPLLVEIVQYIARNEVIAYKLLGFVWLLRSSAAGCILYQLQ